MMEGKKIFKSLLACLMLGLVVLVLPTASHASIVLEYVSAWQAFDANSTFYNKSVAQLIDEESRQHDINPRLILTLLQRESSSITQPSPSSTTRAAWPLFYMYNERMAACLNGDEASCNDTSWPAGGSANYRQRAYDFGGVGQQIAYASYNFQNKYSSYSSTYSSPVVIDGQTITSANIATRVLYAYTPHICSYNDSSNSLCPDTYDADGDGNRSEILVSNFYYYWNLWWGGSPNGGVYNQNNIISDANFKYVAMSVTDINSFLVSQGSWLANYTIAEYISVPYPVVYNPVPVRKTGDINGDNAIDLLDLSILAAWWGTANIDVDFNHDGVVDLLDLSTLASAWGT